jgi:hypothetical protein
VLRGCAKERIDWAKRWKLEFDRAITASALFTPRHCHNKHLHPKVTAKRRVVNGCVRFNQEATRLLGVWTNAHLTFKDQHNQCMQKDRGAEARVRSLTRTYEVVPEWVRAVRIACVQAVKLYESEL